MTNIKELKDKELEKISGRNNDIPNNPKGLMPGDTVHFINEMCGNLLMWGTFEDTTKHPMSIK